MHDLDAAQKANPNRTSLVAVIGAVAALIGAIVGLLSALHSMGWIGTKAPEPRPAVVVMPSAPSVSEIIALQNQLREVRSQLASMSLKASAIPRTAATTASAAAATQHLTLATAKAAKLERDLSTLQTSAAPTSAAGVSPARPVLPEGPVAEASGGGSNIEFETVKSDMKKLSDMQNEMSNVLKNMDELAKQANRKIKV